MLKNAIKLLCAITVIVTMLCSCNDSIEQIASTTDTVVDSQPVAETQPSDEQLSCAGEQQIQNDLIKAEENYFYIDDQSTCLNIDSVEILRRKSDADYDEVHITATYSNTYYKATADYILYYGYYDVGGWCLDDYELIEYQCVAIANPVSDSDVIAFLKNYFTTCKISNRSQSTDDGGVFTDTIDFTATLEFPYLTANFSGWFTMQFYDDYWYETYDFQVISYDWDAFIGEFRFRDQTFRTDKSADFCVSITNIEQTSDTTLLVTYSGSTYLYYKRGGWAEVDKRAPEKTKEFTINNQTISLLGKEINIPLYVAGVTLPWWQSSTIGVYLHRDNGMETRDIEFGGSIEHFDRVVSDEELQDAFDKLHELNP